MISTRRISPFVIPAISSVLVLLLPLATSSSTKSLSSHRSNPHDAQKPSPQLLNQIVLHGFLLWASMGFLMPVGILISRMSNRVKCGKKLKIIFITHVSMQIISILLAIAGAVLAVKYFENSFSNTHQRIGLALYALILVQPLVGLLRPHRGVKGRSIWYFVHWFIGTGLTILAIINIYIGLRAYEKKTLRSTRIWMILFSVEVSLIAFVYLFQDRWDYMQKQGVILGHEQITPTDQVSPPKDTPKESNF